MASALSNWYHNQYASWNRTRRIQAAPFVARTDSQTARVAQTASRMQAPDTVINMGDLLSASEGDRPSNGDKKKQDTLFGPSIGIIDPGPSWTEQSLHQNEKSQLQDVLTPELVKSWIEKSKEASQPTTTLQALVNLKRPSLKLSPILHDDADDASRPHHHGLEFQFDCDAPKCGISLHVAAPSEKENSSSSSSSTQLVNLFNTVVEGGFGRILKLEEGATLELDKYDPHARPFPPASTQPTSDIQSSTSNEQQQVSSAAPSSDPTPTQEPDQSHPQRKRFTLRIRRRTHPHAAEDRNQVSVAGPALQVVDMEAPNPNGTDATSKNKDEGGVKVMIELEALDEHEHGLAAVNSQTTYLHIVRVGAPPAPPTPDIRPWVVRVVKREATIGPHTFHLHEIYGLASHNSAHPNSDQQAHTYPPSTQHIDDDPTSECLLCLSSPREVVLLPCRHLVACKECAMNMVEFGAGGQLVHNEEPVAPTADPPTTGEVAGEGSGAGNANGDDGQSSAPAPAPAPTPASPPAPTRSRRKRKPKGWFCPVCRQPYTSLLRISTTAPVKMEGEAAVANESPLPPSTTPGTNANGNGTPSRTGLFAAISNVMTGSGNGGRASPMGQEAV